MSQLILPPPSIAQHPDTFTEPGELKAWLEELPFGDPLRLMNQLHKQIQLLIRDPKPSKKYAQLLEVYHPLIHALQVSWSPSNIDVNVEIANNVRPLLEKILLELACGHMRLINLRLADAKKPETSHIYHGLLPMIRLVQWDILAYKLTRPAIWRQILQVFSIAELYDLTGQQTKSSFKLAFDPNTSHDIFYGVVALQLSDPYRLDARHQCTLTEGIALPARYLRTNLIDTTIHKVPIDLSGKQAPLRLARKYQMPPRFRYLQLDEFLVKIANTYLSNDDGTVSHWLHKSLKTLSSLESVKDARKSERSINKADCHFIHGATVIHDRLIGMQKRRAQTTGSNKSIYLDDGHTSKKETGLTCKQIECSSGGCSYLLPKEAVVPDVGEWILIEYDHSPINDINSLTLGIMKRRLQREDGTNEIGIETKEAELVPVTLKLKTQKALFLIDYDNYDLVSDLDCFEPRTTHTLHAKDRDYFVEHIELISNQHAEHIRLKRL